MAWTNRQWWLITTIFGIAGGLVFSASNYIIIRVFHIREAGATAWLGLLLIMLILCMAAIRKHVKPTNYLKPFLAGSIASYISLTMFWFYLLFLLNTSRPPEMKSNYIKALFFLFLIGTALSAIIAIFFRKSRDIEKHSTLDDPFF